MQRYHFPWILILAVVAGVTVLFLVGRQHIAFDSDIVASLPQGDPVVADARDVIRHHPIQERIAIDIGQSNEDPELLVAGAEFVEKQLAESGLFKSVGLGREQQIFPALVSWVIENMPFLFSEQDLREMVEPLLDGEKIREALTTAQAGLAGLEGFGQADLIARDPLGLRNIILARLAPLAPTRNASFVQGQLLSSNRRHLLIVAEPASSGFDTAFSQKLETLIARTGVQLGEQVTNGKALTLTPVGAYRAALDNETMAKEDTQRAILFSTIAIALLLLLGFPRWWIGILALLPALAGTMVALFVYSLFRGSISILAIGFGGAIISFTVDYGIAYLLFLDRPHPTRGIETTKEVWSLGLLAMLTTAVSFAFLFIAGFPALSQLGGFAALGVVFTYVFVHGIYPFLFPTVPPARRSGILPLQRIADRLARGGIWAAGGAVVFGSVMLFFAKPDFRVDLQAMNSVRPETLAAEKLVRDVWGNVLTNIFLAVESGTIRDLQAKEDDLADLLDAEATKGSVAAAFVPSQIFPGEKRVKRNLTAWRSFWTPERVGRLRNELGPVAEELGFAPQAFDPFFAAIEAEEPRAPGIPPAFFPLLAIVERQDGNGWIQFSTVQPGPKFQGARFHDQVTSQRLAKEFDPALFAEHLGAIILDGFVRVALIVGVMTFVVALLYLVAWRLTLIALAPTLLSLVCTIGTLRLLGQPLGLPAIMVTAVVIGMGTDYALYLVRAHQRYRDESHPSVGLIRLSVFLSFATTFLGFGVLALSGHALLRSAGLALALGIGYSYLGTVALVPPLLKGMLVPVAFGAGSVEPGSKDHFRRVVRHYRHMEGYPRLFTRFKLLLDPMFPKLAGFVGNPRVILDIGTGLGIPAVWLLELFPQARVYGIERNRKRALFASQALGARGKITVGQAPELPDAPEKADAALMLDMLHYLNDADLMLTLKKLREALAPGGKLVVRATIPSMTKPGLTTRLERARLRLLRIPSHYRQAGEIERMLGTAGFKSATIGPTTPGREEYWFIATPVSVG